VSLCDCDLSTEFQRRFSCRRHSLGGNFDDIISAVGIHHKMIDTWPVSPSPVSANGSGLTANGHRCHLTSTCDQMTASSRDNEQQSGAE